MTPTPRFHFLTGKQHLTFEAENYCTGPIGSRQVQDFISDTLSSGPVEGTGQPVICGMIPFRPEQPAHLLACPAPQSEPLAELADDELPEESSALLEAERENNLEQARHYRQAVASALDAISAGQVKKVVLARQARYRIPEGYRLGAAELVRSLHRKNPAADTFSFTLPDGQHWVGASPEVVADLQQGRFYTRPLAGSRGKGEVASLAQAQQLLLASSKDLVEHAYVVSDIRAHLGAIPGLELAPERGPSVTETDSMYHLGTRIEAAVPAGVKALDLALALHPTPAVGGSPTAKALELISQLEARDRGLYSGLVGWMDGSGRGRWNLVLRCGNLTDQELIVWAGAGIVAGSEPAAELAETEAKMQTLLAAAETALKPR